MREFNNFNYENVPGKPGESLYRFIQELKKWVGQKEKALIERERRKKWYEAKRQEILFWYKLKYGYKKVVEDIQREIENIEKAIEKLEKLEFKLKTSVKKSEVKEKIFYLQKRKRAKERKLPYFRKKYEELEKWVPGKPKDYKKTKWWKYGFAWEINSEVILKQVLHDLQILEEED